jgi:hypothetical protein
MGLVPDRRQVLKEKEEGKERQEREKKVSNFITLIVNQTKSFAFNYLLQL